MGKIAALLLLTLASSQVLASDEPWNMVWVSRSSDWFVKHAHGQLEQRDNALHGVLASDDGTSSYSLVIKRDGAVASGTFEVIPSDAGPIVLAGTYETVVGAGPRGCWETIWLDGGYDHVGLARNIACEP